MCVYGLCVVSVKYVQRSCVFVCEVWGVCEVYVMCVCGLCVVRPVASVAIFVSRLWVVLGGQL